MIHELRTYTLLPKKAPEFLKLTRKVGFEIVGTEREVGRKMGRWLDVVVMQRLL